MRNVPIAVASVLNAVRSVPIAVASVLNAVKSEQIAVASVLKAVRSALKEVMCAHYIEYKNLTMMKIFFKTVRSFFTYTVLYIDMLKLYSADLFVLRTACAIG